LVKIAVTAESTSGDSLLCLNLGVASAAAASFENTVERVNSGNHAWKAEVPTKFANVDEVKNYLGAFLPGDEKYQEEPLMTVEVANGLPDSFDSATNWPKCSVIANVRDQSSCGSCWAFGSVSSFEARACIATGNDVKYSPEQTAFCQGIFGAGDGCNGGNSAWGFFKNTGVVTGGDYPDKDTGATCSAYSLAPCAHHVPASAKYPACPSAEYPNPRCPKTCESGYAGDFASDKLHASKTYSVRGEEQIMTQLVNNGPMYVAFTVYDDFPTYKSGVYHRTSYNALGGHAVTMVGYGELDGEKYWKIKNSWNEQWGDGGHFLIRRGTNECGIESSVGAGDISASEVV
jgi:cathepsin B